MYRLSTQTLLYNIIDDNVNKRRQQQGKYQDIILRENPIISVFVNADDIIYQHHAYKRRAANPASTGNPYAGTDGLVREYRSASASLLPIAALHTRLTI